MLECGGAARPFSRKPAAAAGDTAQLRGCKKSPNIALPAHYNFAQCGVGGRWHAIALRAWGEGVAERGMGGLQGDTRSPRGAHPDSTAPNTCTTHVHANTSRAILNTWPSLAVSPRFLSHELDTRIVVVSR